MKSSPVHPDLVNFQPRTEFSRREVIVTSLATGFALAVQPVGAQTIATSSEGLTAGEVRIPTSSGDIPGYRAMPDKGGPFPVVLVVQEIFGVHEHIKDLCRRLAKAGYFAVAPEMFARQGDVSQIKEIQNIIPIVSKVPDAQAMSDLDATLAWAKGTKQGDSDRAAITGFCWGGRVVWLYAAHNPKLKAGAAWYGRVRGDANPLQPKHPIDIAADVKAPVLGLYAGKDNGIPVPDVEAMREALKKSKAKTKIELYPDAQHGFNADYRPSYNKADAEDAWKKMLAWFRENGVAPKA